MSTGDVQDIYPLTPLQEGMLFHAVSEPHSGAYHQQYVCELLGPLDASAFERAWQMCASRHDVFRTHFVWEKRDRPLQVVRARSDVPFTHLDWTGASEADRASKLEALLRQDRADGFDLGKAPLTRIALIRYAAELHTFVWSFHHAILDGWSGAIVLGDMFAAYATLAEGAPLVPAIESPTPFKDYVKWLLRQDKVAAESHWRARLSGLDAATPIHLAQAVQDAARTPSHARFRARRLTLDAPESAKLRAFAQRQRITLSTLTQCAWALVLNAHSGEDDVLFGATMSGRSGDLPGVAGTVGLLINTLPARIHLNFDAPVGDWLREVQTRAARDSQFEYSALVDIHNWSDLPRGAPMFDSALVFENYPAAELGTSATKVRNVRAIEMTHFPLTAAVMPTAEMVLQLTFDAEKFDEAAVGRMLTHWHNAFASLSADASRPLAATSVLDDDERRSLIVTRNRTASDYPRDKSLADAFDERARMFGERVAFKRGAHTITLREVAERANQLASYLRGLGAQRGMLVGLCLERSFDATIGMLATFKAGAAYVPLDPNYPRERLDYILRDSRAPIVLTHAKHRDVVSNTGAKVVCLDEVWDEIQREPSGAPGDGARANDIAYALYTSGSTGAPKGVMGTHRGAVNRCVWMLARYPFAPDDVCAARSSLSFVDSVWENFGPMLAGVPSVIVDEAVARDPRRLAQLVHDERITRIVLVPGMLRALLDTVPDLATKFARLRMCVVSGEALPVEVGQRFCAMLPKCALLNLYGASETAADATAYEVNDLRDVPANTPIGKPIANTQIFILDRARRLAPEGVPGEIYVAGDCLAAGYFDKPELTRERFVALPQLREDARDGAARVCFKSGDLGRWLPDGNIEYLGRADFQVKVRGNRVELGEVETALASHPGVRQAVVVGDKDANGDMRLVAYVVPAPGHAPTPSELREHVNARLPEFMAPSLYAMLDRLPLTPNGKLNRRALPLPDASASQSAGAHIAPRTERELALATIWEDCLGVRPIGVTDNFFTLGGHSLLAMRVFARIEQSLGVKASVNTLFAAPTIEKLARALFDDPPALAASPAIVTLHAGGPGRPLFVVHGLGGGVLNYVNLADAVGDERAVYGLKPVGYDDGQPPHETVEEMAAYFVEAIRTVQAHGPYAVCGHCFGGVVAFEIARQLEAQGEDVDGLFLLDSFTPERNDPRAAMRHPFAFTRNAIEFVRVNGWAYPLQRARKLVRRTTRKSASNGASAYPFKLEDVLDNPNEINDDVRHLTATELNALLHYRPPAFGGQVSVFRVRVQPLFRAHQRDNGWEKLAAGVQTFVVEGTHRSIVKDPAHARALGERIRRLMAARDNA